MNYLTACWYSVSSKCAFPSIQSTQPVLYCCAGKSEKHSIAFLQLNWHRCKYAVPRSLNNDIKPSETITNSIKQIYFNSGLQRDFNLMSSKKYVPFNSITITNFKDWFSYRLEVQMEVFKEIKLSLFQTKFTRIKFETALV